MKTLLTIALLSLAFAAPMSAQHAPRRFAGAVVGFVIVGGSIRLWQAICHEGSASRRAGLCGR